ncbi:D-tyrosyl-tRNA(Tyr) deacylase [Kosmotoga arenicorallina S304]|uniref:D-aminoacyl-tRNA deacylase n=1 Tax=Kosmotoga arenicorallina S304 TaxID=1453497 RepID=A0A176K0N5_9BACT|nr:D-aminoacyl-tRNA deacylase [Kosmotoga arenicorallina]OAA30025.1 D-tyrosyl-tRNA(Tyr) deacylase [Kosmotoga arenicorallina S304]
MRAVVQRVSEASVKVDGKIAGKIGHGILLLLGVQDGDTDKDLQWMLDKVLNLRIFEDEQGKMNLSLKDVQGQLLVVSQFTLLGDARKGRRPSFTEAASPELAKTYFEKFIDLASREVGVEAGVFQEHMEVQLVNDGPVTILLDSNKLF